MRHPDYPDVKRISLNNKTLNSEIETANTNGNQMMWQSSQ